MNVEYTAVLLGLTGSVLLVLFGIDKFRSATNALDRAEEYDHYARQSVTYMQNLYDEIQRLNPRLPKGGELNKSIMTTRKVRKYD